MAGVTDGAGLSVVDLGEDPAQTDRGRIGDDEGLGITTEKSQNWGLFNRAFEVLERGLFGDSPLENGVFLQESPEGVTQRSEVGHVGGEVVCQT